MIELLEVLGEVSQGESNIWVRLSDGTTVSIARGPVTYGGSEGYWEVWHMHQGQDPIGWLTEEDVIAYVRERA